MCSAFRLSVTEYNAWQGKNSSINFLASRHRMTILPFKMSSQHVQMLRQCVPVVRAFVLRSGDPGFKTRSDHPLNLILVVPGSTSQLHL